MINRAKTKANNEEVLEKFNSFLKNQAETSKELGNLKETARQYKKLLEIDPHYDYGRTLDRYKELLKELKQEQELERFFTEQRQKKPHDGKILREYVGFLESQAQTLEAQEKWKEAADKYKRVLEVDPASDERAYINVLKKMDRLDEADNYYQQKLSMEPENRNLLSNYATYLTSNDQFDRAANIYKDLSFEFFCSFDCVKASEMNK